MTTTETETPSRLGAMRPQALALINELGKAAGDEDRVMDVLAARHTEHDFGPLVLAALIATFSECITLPDTPDL